MIFLQSHPTWVAAQQRERRRFEEMQRHPAYLAYVARQRAAANGGDVGTSAWSSADSPA
ncbi:hypothetical protein [Mycobacterium basiliense]|uniref:hypothetical protein n=1 Tax=Mycobacterium basiliense TaxID=2094119 RepID=UPI001E64779B|nr:hypothetical protein [Mycobacterium basiliense]